MHAKRSIMWPVFTILLVVVKQVSTNLTSIRSAWIGEEFVYKDGTTTEYVVENVSVCGDRLLDSVWSDRFHTTIEWKIKEVYNRVICRQMINRWCTIFFDSRIDLNDDVRAGWPSITDEDTINNFFAWYQNWSGYVTYPNYHF